MSKSLHLLVAGHTNVGKTSLMRTLGRNASFGEVKNAPGTTRHVEALNISDDTNHLLVLYDSPGLEDAIALKEHIDTLSSQHSLEHWQGQEKVDVFLKSTRAKRDFQQEAKVLSQLKNSDAVLFVVDVRMPVLEKYFDELSLLQLTNKPILPILNFTQSADAQEQTWRNELKRVNLHTVVAFDACSPPISGEQDLYQALSVLLSDFENTLSAWQNNIQTQSIERWQIASELVAELLINAAAYRLTIGTQAQEDEHGLVLKKSLASLATQIKTAEQKTMESLKLLYGFKGTELEDTFEIHLQERWQQDLFHPETLKAMGIETGKGVATGAALGASYDLLTLGLSLGTGTVVGATIGFMHQAFRKYGSRINEWIKGAKILTVDDALLSVMTLRLYELIGLLTQRAHASQESIILPAQAEKDWQANKMPKSVEIARAHPQWSAWADDSDTKNIDRQGEVFKLAAHLRKQFKQISDIN